MTKILYVSSLCSENMLKYIFETAVQKPEQAAQKFHRLLTQGFALNLDQCSIQTLSSIPVTPVNHKKKFWFHSSERINGVEFKYIPMLNIPIFKNIGVFIYTFFKVLFWSWFRIGQKKMILCDVLNFTVAFASFLASKLSFTKNVTIVTDLPHNMLHTDNVQQGMAANLYHKLTTFILYRFDAYVLLTEQMNAVVNPKNRPYMIMEGLVDITMESSENTIAKKSKEKIFIYAGGLFEKYGVKTLIDAFLKLENQEARLHLYGNGDMVKGMEGFMQKDTRIVYMGMVPNTIVVADQLAATLLINPRPTTEEFTKFSFPSKNMEYMVSGTPMVTTHLPGMPDEYLDYVFLFEDESVDGMSKTLETILSKSKEELHEFAAEAKAFVIQKKNNQVQAGRILEFMNS